MEELQKQIEYYSQMFGGEDKIPEDIRRNLENKYSTQENPTSNFGNLNSFESTEAPQNAVDAYDMAMNFGLTNVDKSAFNDYKADTQSGGEQLLNAGERLVKGIGYSIVEQTADLLDPTSYVNLFTDTGDYGNSISNWARERKAQVKKDNPLYMKDDATYTGVNGDWTKWLDSGESLVESIVAFGATGLLGGAVINTAAKFAQGAKSAVGARAAISGLAEMSITDAQAARALDNIGGFRSKLAGVYDMASDGVKMLPNAKTVGLATMLTNVESTGIAVETYNNVKASALAKGLSEQEASILAGEAADEVYGYNSWNIALNVSGAGIVLNSVGAGGKALKNFKFGEKVFDSIRKSKAGKLFGDGAFGVDDALRVTTKNPGWKTGVMLGLGEAAQENFEEGINSIGQNKAQADAELKMYGFNPDNTGWSFVKLAFSKFNPLSDEKLSDDEKESMWLGAIGGAGQFGGSKAVSKATDKFGTAIGNLGYTNEDGTRTTLHSVTGYGAKIQETDSEGNLKTNPIYRTYTEDVNYKVGDEYNGAKLTEESLKNLTPEQQVKHKAGEEMVDAKGEKIVKSYEPVYKKDAEGRFILKSTDTANAENVKIQDKAFNDKLDRNKQALRDLANNANITNSINTLEQAREEKWAKERPDDWATLVDDVVETLNNVQGLPGQNAVYTAGSQELADAKAKFKNLNENELQEQQKILKDKLLAEQAWSSNKNGTTERLRALYKAVADMSAEEAKNHNVSPGAAKEAIAQLDKFTKVYNLYTNVKDPYTAKHLYDLRTSLLANDNLVSENNKTVEKLELQMKVDAKKEELLQNIKSLKYNNKEILQKNLTKLKNAKKEKEEIVKKLKNIRKEKAVNSESLSLKEAAELATAEDNLSKIENQIQEHESDLSKSSEYQKKINSYKAQLEKLFKEDATENTEKYLQAVRKIQRGITSSKLLNKKIESIKKDEYAWKRMASGINNKKQKAYMSDKQFEYALKQLSKYNENVNEKRLIQLFNTNVNFTEEGNALILLAAAFAKEVQSDNTFYDLSVLQAKFDAFYAKYPESKNIDKSVAFEFAILAQFEDGKQPVAFTNVTVDSTKSTINNPKSSNLFNMARKTAAAQNVGFVEKDGDDYYFVPVTFTGDSRDEDNDIKGNKVKGSNYKLQISNRVKITKENYGKFQPQLTTVNSILKSEQEYNSVIEALKVDYQKDIEKLTKILENVKQAVTSKIEKSKDVGSLKDELVKIEKDLQKILDNPSSLTIDTFKEISDKIQALKAPKKAIENVEKAFESFKVVIPDLLTKLEGLQKQLDIVNSVMNKTVIDNKDALIYNLLGQSKVIKDIIINDLNSKLESLILNAKELEKLVNENVTLVGSSEEYFGILISNIKTLMEAHVDLSGKDDYINDVKNVVGLINNLIEAAVTVENRSKLNELKAILKVAETTVLSGIEFIKTEEESGINEMTEEEIEEKMNAQEEAMDDEGVIDNSESEQNVEELKKIAKEKEELEKNIAEIEKQNKALSLQIQNEEARIKEQQEELETQQRLSEQARVENENFQKALEDAELKAIEAAKLAADAENKQKELDDAILKEREEQRLALEEEEKLLKAELDEEKKKKREQALATKRANNLERGLALQKRLEAQKKAAEEREVGRQKQERIRKESQKAIDKEKARLAEIQAEEDRKRKEIEDAAKALKKLEEKAADLKRKEEFEKAELLRKEEEAKKRALIRNNALMVPSEITFPLSSLLIQSEKNTGTRTDAHTANGHVAINSNPITQAWYGHMLQVESNESGYEIRYELIGTLADSISEGEYQTFTDGKLYAGSHDDYKGVVTAVLYKDGKRVTVEIDKKNIFVVMPLMLEKSGGEFITDRVAVSENETKEFVAKFLQIRRQKLTSLAESGTPYIEKLSAGSLSEGYYLYKKTYDFETENIVTNLGVEAKNVTLELVKIEDSNTRIPVISIKVGASLNKVPVYTRLVGKNALSAIASSMMTKFGASSRTNLTNMLLSSAKSSKYGKFRYSEENGNMNFYFSSDLDSEGNEQKEQHGVVIESFGGVINEATKAAIFDYLKSNGENVPASLKTGTVKFAVNSILNGTKKRVETTNIKEAFEMLAGKVALMYANIDKKTLNENVQVPLNIADVLYESGVFKTSNTDTYKNVLLTTGYVNRNMSFITLNGKKIVKVPGYSKANFDVKNVAEESSDAKSGVEIVPGGANKKEMVEISYDENYLEENYFNADSIQVNSLEDLINKVPLLLRPVYLNTDNGKAFLKELGFTIEENNKDILYLYIDGASNKAILSNEIGVPIINPSDNKLVIISGINLPANFIQKLQDFINESPIKLDSQDNPENIFNILQLASDRLTWIIKPLEKSVINDKIKAPSNVQWMFDKRIQKPTTPTITRTPIEQLADDLGVTITPEIENQLSLLNAVTPNDVRRIFNETGINRIQSIGKAIADYMRNGGVFNKTNSTATTPNNSANIGIQIGSSNYYEDNNLVFYIINDVITPVANPDKKSVLEVVKADIKKRRENALDAQITGNETIEEFNKKSEVVKINAKYDAELAALNNPVTPTNPTSEVTPEQTQPTSPQDKITLAEFKEQLDKEVPGSVAMTFKEKQQVIVSNVRTRNAAIDSLLFLIEGSIENEEFLTELTEIVKKILKNPNTKSSIVPTSKAVKKADLKTVKNRLAKWGGEFVKLELLNVESISNLHNKKQMGFYANGIISLFSNVEAGTEAHEFVHHVFASYLTPSEIKSLFDELRSRKNFEAVMAKYAKIYDMLEEKKMYDDAVENDVEVEYYKKLWEEALMEEIIADEFKEWVESEGQMELPKTNQTLFEKLWNFIKGLFTFDNWNVSFNKPNLLQLYKAIEEGQFNRKPNNQSNMSAKNSWIKLTEDSEEYEKYILDEFTSSVMLHTMRNLVTNHLLGFNDSEFTIQSFDNIINNALEIVAGNVGVRYEDYVTLDGLGFNKDVENYITTELEKRLANVGITYKANKKEAVVKVKDDKTEVFVQNSDGTETQANQEFSKENINNDIYAEGKINIADKIPPFMKYIFNSITAASRDENGVVRMDERGEIHKVLFKNTRNARPFTDIKEINNWFVTNVIRSEKLDGRIETFMEVFKKAVDKEISKGKFVEMKQVYDIIEGLYKKANKKHNTVQEMRDAQTAQNMLYKMHQQYMLQFTNHQIHVATPGTIKTIDNVSETSSVKFKQQTIENFTVLSKNDVDEDGLFNDEFIVKIKSFDGRIGTTNAFEFCALLGIEIDDISMTMDKYLKLIGSDEMDVYALINALLNANKAGIKYYNPHDFVKNKSIRLAISKKDNEKAFEELGLETNTFDVTSFLSKVVKYEARFNTTNSSVQATTPNNEKLFALQRPFNMFKSIHFDFNIGMMIAYEKLKKNNPSALGELTKGYGVINIDEIKEEHQAAVEEYLTEVMEKAPHFFTVNNASSFFINQALRLGKPIDIFSMNGINSDEEGKDTSDLSEGERIAQQIKSTLDGRMSYLRSADRKVEVGLGFPTTESQWNRKLPVKMLDGGADMADSLTTIYKGYLADELNIISMYVHGFLAHEDNVNFSKNFKKSLFTNLDALMYNNGNNSDLFKVIAKDLFGYNGPKDVAFLSKEEFYNFIQEVKNDPTHIARNKFKYFEQNSFDENKILETALYNAISQNIRQQFEGSNFNKEIGSNVKKSKGILAILEETGLMEASNPTFNNDGSLSSFVRHIGFDTEMVEKAKKLFKSINTFVPNQYSREGWQGLISKETAEKYKNEPEYIGLIIGFIANQTVAYIESNKIVTGDFNTFKTAVDAFKRFTGATATTKTVAKTEEFTEKYARENSMFYIEVNGKTFQQGNFDKDLKITRKYITDLSKATTSEEKKVINNDYFILFKENNPALKNEDFNENFNLVTDKGFLLSGSVENEVNVMVCPDAEFVSKHGIENYKIESIEISIDGDNLNIGYTTDIADAVIAPYRKLFVSTIVSDTLRHKYPNGNYNAAKGEILKNIAKEALRISDLYMSSYKDKKEEGDAFAFCTLDFWKMITYLSGETFGGKQQEAWEKALKGEHLTYEDHLYFQPKKTQHFGAIKDYLKHKKTIVTEKELLKENRTATKSEMVVSVAQLEYLKANKLISENSNLLNSKGKKAISSFVIAFLKHSVSPLIPAVVKGTNLETIMDFMNENGRHIMQFNSGTKIGARGKLVGGEVQDNGFYSKSKNSNEDNNERVLAKETLTNNVTFNISLSQIGIQVDIANKIKTNITAGTQPQKISYSYLYEDGKINLGILGKLKGIYNGKEMSQQEIAEIAVKQMSDSVNHLITMEIDKLLIKIDARISPQGIMIKNKQAFVDIIKEEAMSRDNEQYILDAIDMLGSDYQRLIEGKTFNGAFIEELPNARKVQNIIHAIANSRVINRKHNGGARFQASVIGLEKGKLISQTKNAAGENEVGEFKPTTEKEAEMQKLLGSEVLRFYELSNDGSVMMPSEMMIALPKDLIAYVDKVFGNLEAFNEFVAKVNDKFYSAMEKNEAVKWETKDVNGFKVSEKAISDIVTLMGFRIPTQALSSCDSARVKKFLPHYMGETIIVPSEIIIKAGSDFDIDKLSIYLYNYKIDKNNNIVIAGEEENSVEQRYVAYINAIGSKNFKGKNAFTDAKFFGATLEKNYGIVADFNSFKSLLKEQQFTAKAAQNLYLKSNIDIMTFRVTGKAMVASVDFPIFKDDNIGMLGITRKVLTSEVWIKFMDKVDRQLKSETYKGNTLAYWKKTLEKESNNLEAFTAINHIIAFVAVKNKAEFEEHVIESKKTDGVKDVEGWSDVVTTEVNLNRFANFLAGKAGVGQAAVHVTNHGLAKMAGTEFVKDAMFSVENGEVVFVNKATKIPFTTNRKIYKYSTDDAQSELVGEIDFPISELGYKAINDKNGVFTRNQVQADGSVKVTDLFPVSNPAKNNFEVRVSLGKSMSHDGYNIAETLSGFVNAYVDIAKDPFVFEMNFGSATANIAMMMVRMGIAPKDVALFMKQPIIVKYIQNINRNEGILQQVNGTTRNNDVIKTLTYLEFTPDLMLEELTEESIKSIQDKEEREKSKPRVSTKQLFNQNFGGFLLAIGYDMNTKEYSKDSVKEARKYLDAYKDFVYKHDLLSEEMTWRGKDNKRWSSDFEDFNNFYKDYNSNPIAIGVYLYSSVSSENLFIKKNNIHNLLRESKLTTLINKRIETVGLSQYDSMNMLLSLSGKETAVVNNDMQISILKSFFDLTSYSKDLQSYIRVASPDTRGIQGEFALLQNDMNEYRAYMQNFKEGKSFFNNLEKIRGESIVSGFAKVQERMEKALEGLMLLENSESIKKVVNEIDRIVNQNKTKSEKTFIMTHLMSFLNNVYMNATGDIENSLQNVFNSYLKSSKVEDTTSLKFRIQGKPASLGEFMLEMKKFTKEVLNDKTKKGLDELLYENKDVLELHKYRDTGVVDNARMINEVRGAIIEKLQPMFKMFNVELANKPMGFEDYSGRVEIKRGDLEFDYIKFKREKMELTDMDLMFSNLAEILPGLNSALVKVANHQFGNTPNKESFNQYLYGNNFRFKLIEAVDFFNSLPKGVQESYLNGFKTDFYTLTPYILGYTTQSNLTSEQKAVGIFKTTFGREYDADTNSVKSKTSFYTGSYNREAFKVDDLVIIPVKGTKNKLIGLNSDYVFTLNSDTKAELESMKKDFNSKAFFEGMLKQTDSKIKFKNC